MEIELTKKGTPRKRKPKQKIYYFTKDTEEAILEFVIETNQMKRDKIYRERIDFAFFKLTQNIINTFKFPYMDGGTIEDIQQEVICFLLEKLHMYTQDKGAAFSYFGTITKRYLINENKKAYKKLVNNSSIDAIDDDYSITNTLLTISEKNDDYIYGTENYVIENFIDYVRRYEDKIFQDDKEKIISTAIINIFDKVENIEILKKKAIFIYIREQVNQDTIEITKVINKLKKVYYRLNEQYLEYGFINPNF